MIDSTSRPIVAEKRRTWRWAAVWSKQTANGGKEPHVRHAVRLVEHDGRDVVQADVAALDEILEASRAGHHHIDALVQGAALVAVPGTSEDGDHPLAVATEERASTACTCEASSRVGTRMSALGRRGRDCFMLATIGMPKASVLPEPVGALPQMSRPASAAGMVAD
jgi:hypothetical protein